MRFTQRQEGAEKNEKSCGFFIATRTSLGIGVFFTKKDNKIKREEQTFDVLS